MGVYFFLRLSEAYGVSREICGLNQNMTEMVKINKGKLKRLNDVIRHFVSKSIIWVSRIYT